jgi:glutamine synthetase
MRELTAIYSPTINSYKRYVPGVWAPLTPSWGVDNRTCAVRLVDVGNPSAQRVEYRQTAADINPYLAMAACLGAGLWGIEKQLPLAPESKGDASVGPERLPTSLAEANQLLQKSKAARALFGADFVDHYLRTRDFEVRTFERAVTDFELARYFEVI